MKPEKLFVFQLSRSKENDSLIKEIKPPAVKNACVLSIRLVFVRTNPIQGSDVLEKII